MPEGPLPVEVREFLDRPNFAALATLGKDGAPQVTVIWFALQGEGVLINTRLGRRKVRNLARDPRVALVVYDKDQPYSEVQLRGRAVELYREERAAADIHRLSQRYTGHDYSDPTDRVSYLVTIESWMTYGMRPPG